MKSKTLLIIGLTIVSLHGQQPPADPFRTPKTADVPATPMSEELINISICYEAFSLPLAMAAKLQRQQPGDSDLYKLLIEGVEKDTVRQETFVILRARSGQKAVTESITEDIYPTEVAPPELPNSVSVAIPHDIPALAPDVAKPKDSPELGSMDGVKTPATPAKFETRNVGATLEIEPNLSDDFKYLDIRMSPEIVTSVERSSWGQGLSTTEMPTYETQRILTAFTTRINQPFLLGSVSRPPVSKVDPDSANRVWFAFVTGTLAKP
jgi:hypothetical protein